jgi:2-polyprenyl-3-methyl-5-hydroxy-6-metoxy-1,4-benzoquinol methylase
MNLSPEKWAQISLGDLDGLSKSDPELRTFLEHRQAHIKDKALYEELYGWRKIHTLDFPPEYHNGFPLDSRLEAILQLINKFNLKDVLDIGSRAGYLLFAGRQRNIIDHGTGVEISSSYHDLCTRAMGHFNFSNLEFVNSMFEDFQTSQKYDCAVIAEVLEHVMDPLQVLKKANSHLTDSGYLIISVPVNRPPVTPEEIIAIESEVIQEHVHFFSREKLTELTKQAGFDLLEVFSINQGWGTDVSIYRKNT